MPPWTYSTSVTSGTRALVTGWLWVMKLAQPKNMVFAEDVSKGKPGRYFYVYGTAGEDLPLTRQILNAIN